MARRTKTPGSIDRHGDRWRVRLSVAGERHQFTLATDDRRAVEHFARKKYEELTRQAERRAAGYVTGLPFSALLEKYEAQILPTLAPGAQASYQDSFKPLRRYFVEQLEDPIIESIRPSHVKEYLSWRRTNRMNGSAPLANRTIQKDRAVLHRLFDFAEQLELREGNPVARTEAPKADPRDPVLLTADQYAALLTACGERPMLRLYVLVLGESGVRSDSEALHLRWEDVDLDGGFLWVASGRHDEAKGKRSVRHRTKSGKGRWVPMTKDLAKAMRRHFADYRLAAYHGRRTPWIFHHLSEGRNRRAGARIGSLRHAFESAAERAKLPPELHKHDLRHRRVTTWLAEGKSPVLVKEAMGHSDLRVTMGYAHLAREHLRDLVAQPEPTRRAGRKAKR